MRLYVRCPRGHRIYLSIVADSRRELVTRLGSQYFDLECPYCGRIYTYHVNDVFAEAGPTAIPAGTVIGGIIGALIGGPLGLLLGGGIGATLASGGDAAEKERVDRFNREAI